jgi:hypothetical protein
MPYVVYLYMNTLFFDRFIYEATRLTFEFNSLYSNYNSLSRVRKHLTDEASVIDSLKTMGKRLDFKGSND